MPPLTIPHAKEASLPCQTSYVTAGTGVKPLYPNGARGALEETTVEDLRLFSPLGVRLQRARTALG